MKNLNMFAFSANQNQNLFYEISTIQVKKKKSLIDNYNGLMQWQRRPPQQQ